MFANLINNTLPRLLSQKSAQAIKAFNGGIIGTMFEGLGKITKFGFKVIGESPVDSLLSTEAVSGLSGSKLAALASLGIGAGATLLATSNTCQHMRTDWLIETRAGGYMTDSKTNNILKYLSMATAGAGLIFGFQSISSLAGNIVRRGNPSNPLGILMSDLGSNLNSGLGLVNKVFGYCGDAIKPGLGKITGSPLSLMLGALGAHFAIDQIYLKMPQGNSFLNSFGWGGKKSFVTTDASDPSFLQPFGRDDLIERIEQDASVRGINRSSTHSSFWDKALVGQG